MKMQMRWAGVVALIVVGVGAVPPSSTTTVSAAEDVGRSTMDVYPPSGSKFSCLLGLRGKDANGVLFVAQADPSLFPPESVVGFPGRECISGYGKKSKR